MSSSSSIVIKVKFKETLRRFIASIEDEGVKFAFDVAMLREKIRGFFGFDYDVEFSMTYVDEDGDNVTLVDDDDLVDIVNQSLDPLRITVELNKSDNSSSLMFQSETLNLKSKVPVNNPEAGNLNIKAKETQVQKVTESVDSNVHYFQNKSCRAPINNKEVSDGVERKEDSGSEKKKESQPMNQMGTKTPFTFSKPCDSGSSSGMVKASNQNPFVTSPKTSVVSHNYKDYAKTLTPSIRHLLLPFPPPTLPQVLQNRMSSDVYGSKLNSGFLLDVNVPDGTIMSPSTRFTKVWRMWNNGPFVWPQGTQLQWVSGDSLGSPDSVNVQIPLFGAPVNKELDIAVNFIAPELPGSYVSNWRMASPSGQMFGQPIWVMIEVEDVSDKESGETSINLNLPTVLKNSEVVDSKNPGHSSSKVTDSNVTSVDSKPNDQVSSTTATLSPAEVASMSSLSDAANALKALPQYLIRPRTVNSSVMPSTIVDSAQSSSSTVPAVQLSGSSSQDTINDQEQALLENLEHMGFDQVDLNKEILRRNNYDMEKSIDDLCGVSDWDDDMLMIKNNGSISRVVLDLVNGKRD